MTVVIGWSLPRKIRESRVRRARLDKQSDEIAEAVTRSSAVTTNSAARVERAAVALMERHKQGMMDAAAELRRK